MANIQINCIQLNDVIWNKISHGFMIATTINDVQIFFKLDFKLIVYPYKNAIQEYRYPLYCGKILQYTLIKSTL